MKISSTGLSTSQAWDDCESENRVPLRPEAVVRNAHQFLSVRSTVFINLAFLYVPLVDGALRLYVN